MAFMCVHFQIAVALYMLYDQIGLATFAGLGVLVILLPMNTVTSITMRRFNRQMMRLKDRRIRLMNEVLTGMKVRSVSVCVAGVCDAMFSVTFTSPLLRCLFDHT